MKTRRLLILALAVMVVLSMTAVPAFAATKQVVQVSEKYYYYNEEAGDFQLNSEWKNTFKNGYRKNYESIYYNYDSEDPTAAPKKDKSGISYSYNSNGLMTKMAYKSNGKTTQVIKYTYKGKNVKTRIATFEGNNNSKVTYTYDSKGRRKQVTSYIYQDGKWVKNNYSVTSYDSKGRVKEIKYYYRNEGKLGLSSTVKYTYEKRKTIEKSYNNEGKLSMTATTTVDSKGRTTKYVYETKYGDEDYKSTTTYTYYSNGNTKTMENKDSSGYESKYTYRSDGQTKSGHSKSDTSESSIKYTYNDKGLVTKSVSKTSSTYTDSEGNTETNKTSMTYTYKYKGYYKSKYPKTVFTYLDGKLVSKAEREYQYFVNKTPETEMIGMGG